jgi:hypothetical protein
LRGHALVGERPPGGRELVAHHAAAGGFSLWVIVLGGIGIAIGVSISWAIVYKVRKDAGIDPPL